MNGGWTDKREQLPEDGEAVVLAWHVFIGVMTAVRPHILSNRFITHWMEIDDSGWIESKARKPDRSDADVYGCVVSQNVWGEISVAGWHRFRNEEQLVRWQRPPDPPDGAGELRRQH